MEQFTRLFNNLFHKSVLCDCIRVRWFLLFWSYRILHFLWVWLVENMFRSKTSAIASSLSFWWKDSAKCFLLAWWTKHGLTDPPLISCGGKKAIQLKGQRAIQELQMKLPCPIRGQIHEAILCGKFLFHKNFTKSFTIYIRMRMVGISNFCNVGPGFEHWLINHATLSLASGNQKLQGKNHPCTNGFPGFPFFLQTHMWKTQENWQQNQFRLAPGCFQPEPNLGIHYHSTTTMIYIYI